MLNKFIKPCVLLFLVFGLQLLAMESEQPESGDKIEVHQFIAGLLDLLSNDKIRSLCEQLGINQANIDEPASLILITEAVAVANLGTCMDDTLYTIFHLRNGKDKNQIIKELAEKHLRMQIFHGLIQGPYMKKFGEDASMKETYAFHQLPELYYRDSVEFNYADEDVGAILEDFVKRNPGIYEIEIFGKKVDGSGNLNHVIAAVSDTESVSVCDSGEWSDLPIDGMFEILKSYYSSSSLYRYNAIGLKKL